MLGESAANLRRRRLLTWAAVWLFALRTLVPIGFMVSVEASHAAVMLCPDYGPLPAAAAAQHALAHHHHHAHPGAVPGGSRQSADLPGAQEHGLCPFAGAAHGGWHAPKPVHGAAAPDLQRPILAAADEAALPGSDLPTSHSPRGPPALNPA